MRIIKTILVLLILVFFLYSVSDAGDCREEFSWLPNTDVITGYKIYYGNTDLDKYYEFIDVGLPTTGEDGRVRGTVTGLPCGEKYYFVGVAYFVTNEGVISESSYSEVVVVDFIGRPDAPKKFQSITQLWVEK